jgi:hypothetical protein
VGEGSLAVVRISFKLSCPSIELFPGGPTPECANVGERHARLTERIYHPCVSQLARGVIAIPRTRVHRCRCKQALGRIRSKPFG